MKLITSILHTLKSTRGALLIGILVACFAGQTQATVIGFSFDGNIGVSGTVTGTIYGLTDNGSGQAATSITIDSAPWSDALWTPGLDIFSLTTTVFNNSFDVVGGTLVGVQLYLEGNGMHFLLGTLGLNDLYLNASQSTHSYNGLGFAGATYTTISRDGDVPAPATIALFGLGLVGMGWSRRKKA